MAGVNDNFSLYGLCCLLFQTNGSKLELEEAASLTLREVKERMDSSYKNFRIAGRLVDGKIIYNIIR